MKATRKHFPIFTDWRTSLSLLSIEEKALFLDKLYSFYLDDENTEIPEHMIRLDMFWKTVFPFMDNLQHEYKETKSKRQENLVKARQVNPKLQPDGNSNTNQTGVTLPTKLTSNNNNNNNNNNNKQSESNEKPNNTDNLKLNGSYSESVANTLRRAGVSSIDEYLEI